MIVYLLCESTSGAHESSGVYSIWTSKSKAVAEGQRLMILGYDVEMAEVMTDWPSDSAELTWAPEPLAVSGHRHP